MRLRARGKSSPTNVSGADTLVSNLTICEVAVWVDCFASPCLILLKLTTMMLHRNNLFSLSFQLFSSCDLSPLYKVMNSFRIITSMAAAISHLENNNVDPTTIITTNNLAATNKIMSSSGSFEPISSFDDPKLKWFNPPNDEWTNSNNDRKNNINDGGDGGGKEDDAWWKINDNHELLFAPPAKKDYWRKTYYQPLLVKDDGVALMTIVNNDDLPVTIETSFVLTPQAQFDQAGVLIRIDAEHWIKTGIEVVDGQPRLSCVVTNGFSDWSTQNFDTPCVKLRVHMLPQHGGSFVVEAAPLIEGEKSNEYSFVRIAHMNKDMNHNILNGDPIVKNAYKGPSAPRNSYLVGVFAACPVDQLGMVTTFHNISITKGSTFVHDASNNN